MTHTRQTRTVLIEPATESLTAKDATAITSSNEETEQEGQFINIKLMLAGGKKGKKLQLAQVVQKKSKKERSARKAGDIRL